MKFPTVKLLDYAKQWSTLERSRNPFAVVVMAHLKAIETLRYPRSRLRWKIEIIKGLYTNGWSRTDIWELFRFLDWIMDLPERYELEFERTLAALEEAQNMRYVTTIERRAEARGLERGTLHMAREAVLEILQLRYTALPGELIQHINAMVDLAQLKALLRHAALATSLEEFEQLAYAESH